MGFQTGSVPSLKPMAQLGLRCISAIGLASSVWDIATSWVLWRLKGMDTAAY